MYRLKIIIASTRPGRKGIYVADWFTEAVKKYPDFEVEVLDLAAINLPFLDEPNHPRLHKYEQEHTREWSRKINNADAFVVVIPEYNYGMPPTLANAINFLYTEWNYKPVGFVSYGGLSGGTRSVQMSKLIMTAVRMMPLPEAVNLPFFEKKIDENRNLQSDEFVDKSLDTMMKELLKWTIALKPMRDTA